MDLDKIKRRQSLKIIVSETIMFLTVVATVIILGFIVSGYWINADLEVERQGMLQISSTPTGADIIIDGEQSWLQRTNTSKVLPSGEHTVKLTKEGYDLWEKTINISEGLLYRLRYPRLFPKHRIATQINNVKDTTLAVPSQNQEKLLLINNTTEWKVTDLDSESPETKVLDIAKIFKKESSPNPEQSFGNILSAEWDRDNVHVLIQFQNAAQTNWAIININDISQSVILSDIFINHFDKMNIVDNSANNLLALQDGKLYKVNISEKTTSLISKDTITDFNTYGNEVVFSAKNSSYDATNDINSDEYYIGTTKLSDNKISILQYTSSPTLVAFSRFYDENYIVVLEENTLSIYKKDDYEKKSEYTISFAPDKMKIGYEGESVVLSLGQQIASLDMEASKLREWNIEKADFGWMGESIIYTISEEGLIIYDFDGLNRRNIVQSISENSPVIITKNKWLYYFNNDYLTREDLIAS